MSKLIRPLILALLFTVNTGYAEQPQAELKKFEIAEDFGLTPWEQDSDFFGSSSGAPSCYFERFGTVQVISEQIDHVRIKYEDYFHHNGSLELSSHCLEKEYDLSWARFKQLEDAARVHRLMVKEVNDAIRGIYLPHLTVKGKLLSVGFQLRGEDLDIRAPSGFENINPTTVLEAISQEPINTGRGAFYRREQLTRGKFIIRGFFREGSEKGKAIVQYLPKDQKRASGGPSEHSFFAIDPIYLLKATSPK